jgi:hypothetical protein
LASNLGVSECQYCGGDGHCLTDHEGETLLELESWLKVSFEEVREDERKRVIKERKQARDRKRKLK